MKVKGLGDKCADELCIYWLAFSHSLHTCFVPCSMLGDRQKLTCPTKIFDFLFLFITNYNAAWKTSYCRSREILIRQISLV